MSSNWPALLKSFLFKSLMIILFVGLLYWMMGNLFVAIGFLVAIYIHEMGHYFALRYKGYPVNLPTFIPLLGAVINIGQLKTRDDESFMAYWGPLAGGLASLAALFLYLATGRQEFAAIPPLGRWTSNPSLGRLD